MDGDLPKMNALRSSSALFYNVFQSLDFNLFNWFGNKFENFQVETKLPALASIAPANLDGCLSNDETIIYIESKFLESYLDEPSKLSPSYLSPSKKISESWNDFFAKYIRLDGNNNKIADKKGYFEPVFNHYDGFQMIKHAFGIYRDIVLNPKKYESVKNIVLVNLKWYAGIADPNLTKIDISTQIQLEKLQFFNDLSNFLQSEINELDLSINFKAVQQSYDVFLEQHKNEFKIGRYEYLLKRYDLEVDDMLK